MSPDVSIIVPVRNGARHLPALFKQLSVPLESHAELILVDDGSADDTRGLMEEFARGRPHVVVHHTHTPLGVAAARNLALQHAHGEFIWMADADDDWEPHILATLLSVANQDSADIVVCRADLRFRASVPGRAIDGRTTRDTVGRGAAWAAIADGTMNGYLWNKLFRRSVLPDEPFERISSQSDFTGVIRAVRRAERISFIPDILYHHVVRTGSITRKSDPDLTNLQRAWDVFQAEYGTDAAGPLSQAQIDYFRFWFLALPLAHTPTRVGARRRVRLDGLHRSRQILAELDLRAIAARSRLKYLQAKGISSLGNAYLALLAATNTLKAVSRNRAR